MTLKAIALMVTVIATGAAIVALVKKDIPDLVIPDVAWKPGDHA